MDAAGNLVVKGADTFAFDAANRLTGATVAGVSETYAYDGDGTRTTRQVAAGPVTRFVSDANAPLPLIVDDGTRTYVYGMGLAYAVTANGSEVYHTDRLGSVRELTNGAGTVTATYRTDEWGIGTSQTGGSSQPFGYTGEPRDGTGLTYLRSRYYDPSIGRFTSRDTWPGSPGSPGTLNRYAYVGNNPATSTDPSGHFVDTIIDLGFIIIDLGSLAFGPPKDYDTNSAALGADLLGLCIPFVTGGGLAVRASSVARKAWDLPHWSRLVIQWEHIIPRHMPGGALSAGRTVFPNMSREAVEAAILDAYRHGAKVRVDGDMVLVQGSSQGLTIQMWVNRATGTLETAYPVP